MNKLNRVLESFAIKSVTITVALILMQAVSASAYAASGTVILAKGVVTATDVTKVSRVLAKGSAIEEGDVINTAKKSFAVIRMIDNTKLTLKPDTAIAIGEFSVEEGKEAACINLVKGGLRTVTGLIGKRKPEAFQLDTPVASIGIRGTDFITRLCVDQECLKDEEQYFDQGYSKNEGATLSEEINKTLPEGLYGSCETGVIAMSQCAGQADSFELGKCRVKQQQDCNNVELKDGQAGYADVAVIQGDNKLGVLPSVPHILDRDPYFELSELSDQDLSLVDRFQDGFTPSGQCSIFGI